MVKKNILICGNPNPVIRLMIENLRDMYNIYFIPYSKKSQFSRIKKILRNKVFENKLPFVHNIIVWFFLSLWICRKKNVDIFIAYTDNPIPNGLSMLFIKWLNPQITRIFFPYDVVQYALIKEYKYKLKNRLFYFFDRICYENCQKIITKGFENDLDYLGGIYKIKDKSHFVFNTLVDTNDVIEVNKKKVDQNKIRMVYAGGIENSDFSMSNYQSFKDLLNNKNIVIHVYSDRSHLIEDLSNTYDNLIVHDYIVNHRELINEISKYDFGLALHKPSKYDFLQSKMASGMKIYDYLAAGLPIITDGEHESLANMIENNDFGFSIPYDNVNEMNEYIKKHDYQQCISSIHKNRDKYFLNKKNINKFCEWLET